MATLTADYRNVITDNNKCRLLIRSMNLSDEVLFWLNRKGIIDDDLNAKIEQDLSMDGKNLRLLKFIKSLPDDKINSVMENIMGTLAEFGQEHVANIFIDKSTVNKPLSDERYELLCRKLHELCQYVDADDYLVTKLSSLRVLRYDEPDRILHETGYSQKAKLLITILMRKPDSMFEQLIDSLKETNQEHVVYILTGRGPAPLAKFCKDLLEKSRSFLVEQMIPNSMLSPLIDSGVFIGRDEERFDNKKLTRNDKNELMLRLISRKSQQSFEQFVAALVHTKQRHLAVKLVGVQVAAKLVVRCNAKSREPKPELEKQAKEELMKYVDNKDPDESEFTRKLGHNGLSLSFVGDGCIAVHFRCLDMQGLQNLQRMYRSHNLDIHFTNELRLSLCDNDLSLEFTIQNSEFGRCKDTLEQNVLMTPAHRQALFAAEEKIADQVTFPDSLLEKLNLSQRQRQEIENEKDAKIRAKMLFCAISCRPDCEFEEFIKLFWGIGQVGVVEFLQNYSATESRSEVQNRPRTDQTPAMKRLAAEDYDRPLKRLRPSTALLADVSSTAQVGDKVCVSDHRWPLMQSQTDEPNQEEPGVDGSQCCYMILCLPLELHKMLLMSSARQLAKTLLKTDSRIKLEFDKHSLWTESRCADVETFVTLASVCQHFHTIFTKRKWFTRTLKQYLTAVCRPYRLSLGPPQQLTLTRQGDEVYVCGLTQLDNKLYVLYDESSATIDVYTTKSQLTQLSSIHVNGLGMPTDIAACSINNCLYVADGVSDCVWKVKTDGKVDKWLDVKEWVSSLSVTSEGHIVMLINELEGDEWISCGRVKVYSADGVELSNLALPRDIVQPWHVVQTVNKSFIVSHGGSDTELHRVCEVNNAGVLVQSYGGSRGRGLGQLDWPEHVALDKDERIFVADLNNNRVLLLDKHLNIQRVLLTWSRYRPMCLIYDLETTQLTVLLGSVGGVDKVEIYSLL